MGRPHCVSPPARDHSDGATHVPAPSQRAVGTAEDLHISRAELCQPIDRQHRRMQGTANNRLTSLVEPSGIEPLTLPMPFRRSPSRGAMAPTVRRAA